jgi:hypothetical protein
VARAAAPALAHERDRGDTLRSGHGPPPPPAVCGSSTCLESPERALIHQPPARPPRELDHTPRSRGRMECRARAS